MTVAEGLDFFAERYGEPTVFVPAPEEVLNRLAPQVPEVMLDYWQRFGFSVFQDGYMQLVNPETYAAALEDWLKGTSLDGTDQYCVIQKDAFGRMIVWGQNTGINFTIRPTADAIQMRRSNQAKDIAAGDINRWAERCFHEIKLDKDDVYGRLFTEATDRLGPLGADQMLGLVPAVPLGGQLAAENFQIFSAPEHLAMLAQIGQRHVLTFDDLARQVFGEAGAKDLNKQLDD